LSTILSFDEPFVIHSFKEAIFLCGVSPVLEFVSCTVVILLCNCLYNEVYRLIDGVLSPNCHWSILRDDNLCHVPDTTSRIDINVNAIFNFGKFYFNVAT
jgi:hypothetical protein